MVNNKPSNSSVSYKYIEILFFKVKYKNQNTLKIDRILWQENVFN